MEEEVNSPLGVVVELDSQAINLYVCVVKGKYGRHGVDGQFFHLKKENLIA